MASRWRFVVVYADGRQHFGCWSDESVWVANGQFLTQINLGRIPETAELSVEWEDEEFPEYLEV